MWFRLMCLAFVTNGLCVFGHSILANAGLSKAYLSYYLIFWYAAGASLVMTLYMWDPKRPYAKELVLGGVLGILSLCGQTSLGRALAADIPGNVAFPVAYGAGCSSSFW